MFLCNSWQLPDEPPHSDTYCFKRKNKFPTGDVMVMLFVPLMLLIMKALVTQFVVARFAVCCRV